MTTFSSQELAQRTIERRAIEAVIWGMPAVNFDRMYQAMVHDAKAGEGSNKVVYWSRLFDWKNQTLTPNPDSIYLMPFFNTKDVGPVVLEIPPADEGSITGSIDDCWQAALEDVGPAGVDKGKGGKYLILPPDYKDKRALRLHPPASPATTRATRSCAPSLRAAATRMSPKPSPTASGSSSTRSRRPLIRLQPNSSTPSMWSTTPPFPGTCASSNRSTASSRSSPGSTRDKAMIDQLKSIGIEKGKPFNPDAKTQDTLKAAAVEAHAWLDRQVRKRLLPAALLRRRPLGYVPVSPEVIARPWQTFYAVPDSIPSTTAALAYTIGFFSAKHLGAGQFYLMTFKDKDGHKFEGGSTYHLNVPANAPVTQYWSATVYDRETHALIRNMQWPSRSSTDPRAAKERRRLRRHLLRTQGPRRQRIQLGSHRPKRKIRSSLPLLWPSEAAVRQDLEAARYRSIEVTKS